jgi:3-dehydroquinate synthase
MKTLSSHSYPIHLGEDSLQALDLSKYSQIGILVDENSKKHCLPLLLKAMPTLSSAVVIAIESGEQHKNLSSCELIWQALTEAHFDRSSLVINLGGGVIGDMGGFAAATYKRGIDFLQVPTTLLAMVDASVGGKLGIDFLGLKNQIGLFKEPIAVLINPLFLNSLPERQLLSGLAEVVKHALIADEEYWNNLTATSWKNYIWEDIIWRSIQIKSSIVSADPFEKGERKKLNFGHTIGHAIESYWLKKGKDILHGEAIALGMIMESKLSPIQTAQQEEIITFIQDIFKLPSLPPKEALIDWMKHDKKNANDKVLCSLLDRIGSCSINHQLNLDELPY